VEEEEPGVVRNSEERHPRRALQNHLLGRRSAPLLIDMGLRNWDASGSEGSARKREKKGWGTE